MEATTPVEQDSISHLDFESTCRVQERTAAGDWQACGKPSTVLVVCQQCAHDGTICEPHAAVFKTLKGRATCRSCGRRGVFVDVFSIVTAG
jgi:hypothetical protein